MHSKQSAFDLINIALAKGIDHFVISPGSRNAPLTLLLARNTQLQKFVIADERSAAYFALGLAQKLKRPVALVCTSGTAAVNYAPAMAEAFYKYVPLVAITADRPTYWIDQNEGQSVRQGNIYAGHTVASASIQEPHSAQDLWFNKRKVNEVLNTAIKFNQPVHLNLPFSESLYDLEGIDNSKPALIDEILVDKELSKVVWYELASIIKKSTNIVVLVGQYRQRDRLSKAIKSFADKTGALIIAEPLSNLNYAAQIDNIDQVLWNTKLLKMFMPDLIINIGGDIISKNLKAHLRSVKPKRHWNVNKVSAKADTFMALTKSIETDEAYFFEEITKHLDGAILNSNWQKFTEGAAKLAKTQENWTPDNSWSEIAVTKLLINHLPKNVELHLGNSMPVRYASFWSRNIDASIDVQGNRGTSGIDGSLSTAIGYSAVGNKEAYVLIGDMSFIYDSNALWNNYVSKKLKIAIYNNEGGAIFSIINGPSTLPERDQFFVTPHKVSIEYLCKAFNIQHFCCSDISSFDYIVNQWKTAEFAAVLELKFDSKTSKSDLLKFKAIFDKA